ncbi:hypothetical protein SDC9_74192 [bioreactor metagenome]|uniref:Uncharacterized protein n=1 Tax=bioreactor metagenome TaxID=1076179 RepID=A0A644YH82_9ZZZZ
MLRVEHRRRADALSCAQARGEVVRACRGCDHAAGGIQDRRHDDLERFPASRRADDQQGVFHARPHVKPMRGTDPVANVGRCGVLQRGTEIARPREQRLGGGGLSDVLFCCRSGQSVRVLRALV